MTTLIEDPIAPRAGATEPDAQPELTREQVDADFPPGSRERRIATARARAMNPGSQRQSLYEILRGMPEMLRQVLNSQHETVSQWLTAWSESIVEQAKLDKKAALRSAEQALQIASEQRNREALSADERRQLGTVIENLTELRNTLADGETHALNTQASRSTLADATPADSRAGLAVPTGGVRTRPA